MLLNYGGLLRFWEIFQTAISISPLDGEGLPTVSMINQVLETMEMDLTVEEFWSCTMMALAAHRKKAIAEIKKALRRSKHGSKI